MNNNMKSSKEESYNEKLKVLFHQSNQAQQIDESLTNIVNTTENAIKETEKMLEKLEVPLPDQTSKETNTFKTHKSPEFRTWDELLEETKHLDEDKIDIHDLLSEAEIEQVLNSVESIREDFKSLHKLDKIDWSIVGVAGVLAALTDIFLVQMPKHPGFLGAKSNEGGTLSNYLRTKLK